MLAGLIVPSATNLSKLVQVAVADPGALLLQNLNIEHYLDNFV